MLDLLKYQTALEPQIFHFSFYKINQSIDYFYPTTNGSFVTNHTNAWQIQISALVDRHCDNFSCNVVRKQYCRI